VGLRYMLGAGYWPDNDSVADLITLVFFIGVELNVVLFLFNLIPVAPLDGSHVLLDFVSPRTAMDLRVFMNQYGLLLLVAVVIFAGQIISPFLVPLVNFFAGQTLVA
jgi:Zn-dependent protease